MLWRVGCVVQLITTLTRYKYSRLDIDREDLGHAMEGGMRSSANNNID